MCTLADQIVYVEGGRVVERAAAVLRSVPAGQDLVDHELLEHMLETRTRPCTEMADARDAFAALAGA